MNIVIGVISPNTAWVLPREYVTQLARDFPQHRFVDVWDRSALRTALLHADAAFAAYIDRDIVPRLSGLRWVQAPAVGVGHILSEELLASPIVLTSARGIRARAIAEHILAVMLALTRQIHTAVRRQVAHEWPADGRRAEGGIRTLDGAQLGIVGLGTIGSEVAQLAAAFGMRIVAVRKHVDRGAPAVVAEVWPPERLPRLLSTSDVVVLSAPLTAETSGIVGRDALRQVKRGALLINIGRGQLLDEQAVLEALNDGRLGGAALDVFTSEPLDPASPFWDLANVIVTPHISGAMGDYWTPLVELFAENLRRFESGKVLLNVVDKRAGY